MLLLPVFYCEIYIFWEARNEEKGRNVCAIEQVDPQPCVT